MNDLSLKCIRVTAHFALVEKVKVPKYLESYFRFDCLLMYYIFVPLFLCYYRMAFVV